MPTDLFSNYRQQGTPVESALTVLKEWHEAVIRDSGSHFVQTVVYSCLSQQYMRKPILQKCLNVAKLATSDNTDQLWGFHSLLAQNQCFGVIYYCSETLDLQTAFSRVIFEANDRQQTAVRVSLLAVPIVLSAEEYIRRYSELRSNYNGHFELICYIEPIKALEQKGYKIKELFFARHTDVSESFQAFGIWFTHEDGSRLLTLFRPSVLEQARQFVDNL